MLHAQDNVFFLTADHTEHSGTVLGAEAEYFWLWVPNLGNVYQGHPDRVITISGRKIFWVDDRCQATKDMFDKKGGFSSDIFGLAKDPKPMIALLQTLKIAGAI